MIEWWNLPGPSRFVDNVLSDLRAGRNVVVAVPQYLDEGCGSALDRRVWDAGLSSVRLSDFDTELGSAPVACLSAAAGVEARTATELAMSPALSRRVLLVDAVGGGTWPIWRDCLKDFASGTQQLEADDRGLMCLLLRGVAAGQLPAEDVTVAVHKWERDTTRLDLDLWAAQLVAQNGLSGTRRRLAAALVAELGSFDPALARRLATVPFEELLAPFPTMEQYGREMSWCAATPRDWHLGTVHDIEGSHLEHPALLVLKSKTDDVLRLIWRAEVAVVFPYLEEERLRLVKQNFKRLRVPFPTPNGVVSDVLDLELVHLWRQLATQLGGPTARRLQSLIAIRNALAHFEAAPAADILACFAG